MSSDYIEDIKSTLRFITLNFGLTDVEFIATLKYPATVTVIRTKTLVDNPEHKMNYTVENLESLHGLFRMLAELSEPLEIKIDKEVSTLVLEKEEE